MMRLLKKSPIACRRTELALAVLLAVSSASAGAAGADQERSMLRFAEDGKPSLMLGGVARLQSRHPGAGFFLETDDGRKEQFVPQPMSADPEASELVLRTPDGDRELFLRRSRGADYLALHISRMAGIPTDYPGRLLFELNASGDVRAVPLDYMTRVRRDRGQIEIEREALWEQSAANPHGSFALYAAADADEEDEILLHIWANEGLPHPKVDGPWTVERARRWIDRWLEVNADASWLNVIPANQTELSAALPYARKMDAKAIYLWPGVWRGEYWLKNRRNAEVNPELFPGGAADLRRLSCDLQRQGMTLKLHYLCGTIGEYDPEFCGAAPDSRLARWGGGTLAEPISADAATIFVRPNCATHLPRYGAEKSWRQDRLPPPQLPPFWDFQVIQVGDELVQIGQFEQTDQHLWKLTDCRRGLWATKAVEHGSHAPWSGLLRPYGQDFVPDNNSDLLPEIARGWAELNNRLQASLASHDGYENHGYAGSWGQRKFAALVYENLDHPVEAYASSGRPPWCYFEYRLNRVRRAINRREGRPGPVRCKLAFVTADLSRPAVSLDDVHFTLACGAADGATAFNVGSYDVKGIPLPALREHGQTDDILASVAKWKRVSHEMCPADRSWLAEQVEDGRSTVRLQRETIRDDGANVIRLQAERVLVPDAFANRWLIGQEHGVIAPRMYLRTGQDVELDNPFAEQTPRIILRVLPAFEGKCKQNIELTTAEGLADPRLRLTAQNDSSRVVRGDRLPVTQLRPLLDLSKHRGLGMWVTGDGKGATLLFTIHGGHHRDYAIPIDFSGRRWIEIPHGEVAWVANAWGWRYPCAKLCNYRRITAVQFGVAEVPPHTDSQMTVDGVKFLAELARPLVDPVIEIAAGRLRIRGQVPSDHYLVYEGGSFATVCDANWNPQRQLPVIAEDFKISAGRATFAVRSGTGDPQPWLAAQCFVRGTSRTLTLSELQQ